MLYPRLNPHRVRVLTPCARRCAASHCPQRPVLIAGSYLRVVAPVAPPSSLIHSKFNRMTFSVDFVSLVSAFAASCIGSYVAQIQPLRGYTEECHSPLPRTSSFKECRNTPIKRMKCPFPSKANTLELMLGKIRSDPNLKSYAVVEDICEIVRALYKDQSELLLGALDSIVLSEHGVEVLVVELERKMGDENFDRSLLIDITAYRSELRTVRMKIEGGVGIAAFLLAGNGNVRARCAAMYKSN